MTLYDTSVMNVNFFYQTRTNDAQLIHNEVIRDVIRDVTLHFVTNIMQEQMINFTDTLSDIHKYAFILY